MSHPVVMKEEIGVSDWHLFLSSRHSVIGSFARQDFLRVGSRKTWSN